MGKEATGPEEFDGIDLTNKLGADKVLFKASIIPVHLLYSIYTVLVCKYYKTKSLFYCMHIFLAFPMLFSNRADVDVRLVNILRRKKRKTCPKS